MRLFDDGDKSWAKTIVDVKGEILVVSQFTLYGFLKGNKPDFHFAMANKPAETMYIDFIRKLTEKYNHVQTGFFGEMMKVNIENDGPCTIILDSREEKRVEGE